MALHRPIRAGTIKTTQDIKNQVTRAQGKPAVFKHPLTGEIIQAYQPASSAGAHFPAGLQAGRYQPGPQTAPLMLGGDRQQVHLPARQAGRGAGEETIHKPCRIGLAPGSQGGMPGVGKRLLYPGRIHRLPGPDPAFQGANRSGICGDCRTDAKGIKRSAGLLPIHQHEPDPK